MTVIGFSLLKKIFTVLFLITATLVLSYPALAIDSTQAGVTKSNSLRQNLEQKKLTDQQRLSEKRAEIASKAAILKERLQNFKDKIKAATVQRISDTLNKINQNQTTQMQKHLDKMSGMVTRLESRINEAPGAGQSTASASAALNDAKQAIASASAAVTTQAGMDYTISVSSESAVRADSKQSRDKLHNDLKSVRQLVINAKQAVAKTIMTVAKTLGGVKSGR